MNEKTQKIRVFKSASECAPKLLKNKGFIPWNNPFFACFMLFFVYNGHILEKKKRKTIL